MTALQKSECPGPAGQVAEHTQEQTVDCDSMERQRKQLMTMQARFALLGYGLHELSDGYMVSRWGLNKTVPDLGAASAFLKMIGGTA